MDRRTVALAAVLLAALAAGCSTVGPASDGANTSSDPRSTSATPHSGGMALTDCPYLLDTELASENARDRVDDEIAYEDLSDARQSEFRGALNGTVELSTLPDRWSQSTLVSYENETYHVVASTC